MQRYGCAVTPRLHAQGCRSGAGCEQRYWRFAINYRQSTRTIPIFIAAHFGFRDGEDISRSAPTGLSMQIGEIMLHLQSKMPGEGSAQPHPAAIHLKEEIINWPNEVASKSLELKPDFLVSF